MICPNCRTTIAVAACSCHCCGASLQPSLNVRLRPAGLWLRLLASLFDLMILGAPILYVYDRVMPDQTPEEKLETQALLRHHLGPRETIRARERITDRTVYFAETATFVAAPYFILTESSALQGTLGKWLLGLRVADLNGRRIRRGRAVRRYFARFLSAIPLLFGFMMVAMSPKKQALHDMVAGTVVLRSGGRS